MQKNNKSSAADSNSEDYPPPRYAWSVTALLTAAYVISFIDRQVLALLVEPIKADLDLSDTQMSLLMGLAFGIFYTVLGIPIARLADRYSRRSIISVGIALWCFATAACGLARSYAHLFVARVGVGVGEASLTPSAMSLISDYFPPHSRGRAIAFYNMGISVGVGIAMLLGGVIVGYAQTAPPLALPFIGTLKPWQAVFMIVGLPGLVLAVLMLGIREPARKELLAGTERPAFSFVLRYLAARWRTYATLFLGMSVVTIIGYAYFSWIPTMFIRTWGWSIRDVGLAYGLIMLIFGPLGVNFAGWLADRRYRAGRADAHLSVALLGTLIGVPAATLAPLMPTPALALLMLIPASVGPGMSTATGASALMMITPNQFRAQAAAMYLFVISLMGLTLGPTVVALVTDYVFADEGALRYSIALVSGVAGALAWIVLGWCTKHYRVAATEAANWQQH